MSELNKRIKSSFYLRLPALICVPLQNLGTTQRKEEKHHAY